MKKTHVAYEVSWTQCEYGGPSLPAGSTLHLTLDAALAYKKLREGDLTDLHLSREPFHYRGSNPRAKVVDGATYKRLKEKE
jgi:hypothetical protein